MAAMLPIHDVNLACQELDRCVREFAAVGACVRPNYVNGRYSYSTDWDPLYSMLQVLKPRYAFHEGTGSYYSTIEPRFSENRFMRHVASHWTEVQFALIALMLGGILEFRQVSTRVSNKSSIAPEIAGKILYDGARLYGFTQVDFKTADEAARRRDDLRAAQAPR
jgi:hypothetical protein